MELQTQNEQQEQLETKEKQLTQLYEMSREMTHNELASMMYEIRVQLGNTNKEGTHIPEITRKDFAGILLMERADDPAYSHSVSSGVDVWRKKVNRSTWNGVARATFRNISPREMTRLYWDYTVRRRWDSFYTVLQDLEVLANGDVVSRTATWTPPFFTPRDYVHVRRVIETDECCVGVYLPAAHRDAPPAEGFTRGLVNFSGFVFRRNGQDCTCTLMTQTDIAIALPDFLINKFVGIAVGRYVHLLRDAAAQHQRELRTLS